MDLAEIARILYGERSAAKFGKALRIYIGQGGSLLLEEDEPIDETNRYYEEETP